MKTRPMPTVELNRGPTKFVAEEQSDGTYLMMDSSYSLKGIIELVSAQSAIYNPGQRLTLVLHERNKCVNRFIFFNGRIIK